MDGSLIQFAINVGQGLRSRGVLSLSLPPLNQVKLIATRSLDKPVVYICAPLPTTQCNILAPSP